MEPPLSLCLIFALQKCYFLLFLCSRYKNHAKDKLNLEPKRSKSCRKVHAVRQACTGEQTAMCSCPSLIGGTLLITPCLG